LIHVDVTNHYNSDGSSSLGATAWIRSGHLKILDVQHWKWVFKSTLRFLLCSVIVFQIQKICILLRFILSFLYFSLQKVMHVVKR
jgi:hypothetical protein